MNKFKTLVLFYFFLFSISIILYSCCTNPEEVTLIGGGEISFFESEGLPSSGISDRLTGLPFIMSANMELLFADNFSSNGFMASAYGVSCEPDYQNSMSETTFALSCDSDFVYAGETIMAGQDFSELNGVFVNFDPETISVNIAQNFMDEVEFTNGETTFRMNIQTSDNVNLESEGTILIAIQ